MLRLEHVCVRWSLSVCGGGACVCVCVCVAGSSVADVI